MSHHVLISCPLLRGMISEYDDRFERHNVTYDVADVDQQLSEAELLECIDDYDGMLVGDDELTAAVLNETSRLRVISKWGIGTDDIDEEAAAVNDIAVYNTPGTLNDEVATVVIGYAVMLTRELHQIDRSVRKGDWYAPRGVSLTDKTLGVVGVGDIGSTVARKASGIGMEVLGTDVEPISENVKRETEIERVALDDLLAASDIVSLNCPLTESTRNVIGRDELDELGPDGYLINTARGNVVNQPALVDALQEGHIAGAALDVFEEEPLPTTHPLTELDNVILGSHNAQNTDEAVKRVTDKAVDNLLDGLKS